MNAAFSNPFIFKSLIMKRSILILTLFISVAAFAGNDDSSCSGTLSDDIKNKIESVPAFKAFDLEGLAVIAFTIDDSNTIHVQQVMSNNTFLKNHIIDSLNGQTTQASCFEKNKQYVIRVKYIQYI